MATLPKEFERSFSRKHGKLRRDAIRHVFRRFPVSPRTAKALDEIALHLIVKQVRSPFVSGVVVGGFGDSDPYPSLVHFEVDYIIGRQLRYAEYHRGKLKVGPEPDKPCCLVPFAQREMVDEFMSGINPLFEKFLVDRLRQSRAQLEKNLLALGKGRGLRGKVRRAISAALADGDAEVSKMLQEWKANHSQPITALLAFQPKGGTGRNR